MTAASTPRPTGASDDACLFHLYASTREDIASALPLPAGTRSWEAAAPYAALEWTPGAREA